MSELLLCPFCGGEANTVLKGSDDWHIECHDCASRSGIYGIRESAIAAWNTRVERTCHMIVYKQDKDKPRHEQWGVCSECRELLEPFDNYCPNCGSRVLEDKDG